jgi:two-component system nitrogen regulation sensor histidine kinase NtrY
VAPLVGVFLARRVTRRVARLHEAARRVGAGDLAVRVHPVGKDELDELGRAFDRMVAELADARSRLEYLQKVSAWQEVARRLAHEIKNPLTPIQLSVQELASQYRGDDPAYRKLLDTAREILHEEITGLRRLVDDFSAFAKLPKVEPAPVDLGALVAEAVRLQPEWQPFVHVDPPAAPVHAQCDKMLFRRVIANLVENAIQATRGAGKQPEVWLRVEAHTDGRAALIVDDNGPGVPAAERQRIFDPYVTHREGGTGLGLAIVRKIVIDHGGDVSVQEAPAPLGGARLLVEIPAR